MDELKPCPFCGRLPEMQTEGIRVGGELIWQAWFVEHNCSCLDSGYGRIRTFMTHTREEAVELWNRRES